MEDLKGVTLELLEQTTEKEQANFLEAWKIIQRRAAVAMRHDFQMHLGGKATLRAASDIERVGHIYVPLTLNESAALLAGVMLEVDESHYLGLYIYRVRLFVQSAGTTTLMVLDGEDGTELLSQAWEVQRGWNEVAINRQFLTQGKGTRLFVGYLTDGLQTVLSTTAYDSDGSCSSSRSCDGRLVDVYGGTFDPEAPLKTLETLGNNGNTYGLQVDYDLRCSIDPLICQMRDLLANAYYALIGREIMDQRLSTTRLNKWTIDNKEQVQALRMEYDEHYKAALTQAVESIAVPLDYCFCPNQITHGTYAL